MKENLLPCMCAQEGWTTQLAHSLRSLARSRLRGPRSFAPAPGAPVSQASGGRGMVKQKGGIFMRAQGGWTPQLAHSLRSLVPAYAVLGASLLRRGRRYRKPPACY